MKVALVHDYLNEFGGAERVLLALSRIYTKAPIYTIYYKKNSLCGKIFRKKKIIESWFSCLPFPEKLISPLRFLVPLIWGRFDFSDYDLVITSASWAITKGMKNAKCEVCYLHTPPRYLWGYDTSRNWEGFWFAGAVKLYALIVNHFLRMYDFSQAQKVAFFIANSKNVAKRIEKFYRKKNYKVVYPPIKIFKYNNRLFSGVGKKDGYFLTGGRMVRTKNFDLIIKASEIAKVKLKVFGSGVEERRLKKIADKNVEFVGRVSDKELVALYANSKAFIVAQKDEDFGMTPLEAASFGVPTLAYRKEGYLESIIEGKTGLFFDDLSLKSIASVIKKSKKIKWNKDLIKSHAKKFNEERFRKEIRSIIREVCRNCQK